MILLWVFSIHKIDFAVNSLNLESTQMLGFHQGDSGSDEKISLDVWNIKATRFDAWMSKRLWILACFPLTFYSIHLSQLLCNRKTCNMNPTTSKSKRFEGFKSSFPSLLQTAPDSKLHGANMGPTWPHGPCYLGHHIVHVRRAGARIPVVWQHGKHITGFVYNPTIQWTNKPPAANI